MRKDRTAKRGTTYAYAKRHARRRLIENDGRSGPVGGRAGVVGVIQEKVAAVRDRVAGREDPRFQSKLGHHLALVVGYGQLAQAAEMNNETLKDRQKWRFSGLVVSCAAFVASTGANIWLMLHDPALIDVAAYDAWVQATDYAMNTMVGSAAGMAASVPGIVMVNEDERLRRLGTEAKAHVTEVRGDFLVAYRDATTSERSEVANSAADALTSIYAAELKYDEPQVDHATRRFLRDITRSADREGLLTQDVKDRLGEGQRAHQDAGLS